MTRFELESAAELVTRRADLYTYLEEKAVRVIEAAKAQNAIDYGDFKTDLGGALYELESYLEQQGFCFCSHCGSITQRSADEACGCEEEDD